MKKAGYIPDALEFYFRWVNNILANSSVKNLLLFNKILASAQKLYSKFYDKTPIQIPINFPVWPEMEMLFFLFDEWFFQTDEKFYYYKAPLKKINRPTGTELKSKISAKKVDERTAKRKNNFIELQPPAEKSIQNQLELRYFQPFKITESKIENEAGEFDFPKHHQVKIAQHIRKAHKNDRAYHGYLYEKKNYLSVFSKLPSRINNGKGGIFRKSNLFIPFSILAFGKNIKSNAFSRQDRYYPPVEYTHKPSFAISTGNSKGIIRDPANPHRYKIKESLIPSISQIQKTLSTDNEEQIGYKTFRFSTSNTPEHINYEMIKYDSVDPLINLIRFNYFTEDFIKDVVTKFQSVAKSGRNADSKIRIDEKVQEGTTNNGSEISQEKGDTKKSIWQNPFKFYQNRSKKVNSHVRPQVKSFSPFHQKSLQSMVLNSHFVFSNKVNMIDRNLTIGNANSIDTHFILSGGEINYKEIQELPDVSGWNFYEGSHDINGWNFSDNTTGENRHGQKYRFKKKIFPTFLKQILHLFKPAKRLKPVDRSSITQNFSESSINLPVQFSFQEKIVPVDEKLSNSMEEPQMFRKHYHPVLETWHSTKEWYSSFGGEKQNLDYFHQNYSPDSSPQILPQEEKSNLVRADFTMKRHAETDQTKNAAEDILDPEIFFRKHVPEAFSNNAEIAQSSFETMISDYSTTGKKELETLDRKRMLLELSDRVWEHVKRKLKQR